MGAFKDIPAVDVGVAAAAAVLAELDVADVADVIVGNVLQAGQGINPARQIGLSSGLPIDVPAQTINRGCGSEMQAVVSAVHGRIAGDCHLYIAGGTESMARAPFLASQMRGGHKMGDAMLLDRLINDGLTDPTHGYQMGLTAENITEKWGHHARAAGHLRRRKTSSRHGSAEARSLSRRNRRGGGVLAQGDHYRGSGRKYSSAHEYRSIVKAKACLQS
jgi:acetyl-CoA acetyltransferase